MLRDLRRGGVQREAFCLKVSNGVPEAGTTNSKTNKTWHACSRLEPMNNALLACSTPKHNEANILATIAVCDFDNVLAISALIQPFNFPDIWFHPSLSQFFDGPYH